MARRRANSDSTLFMRGVETTHDGEDPGDIDRSPTYRSMLSQPPSYYTTSPPFPLSSRIPAIREGEGPGNVSQPSTRVSNFTRVPRHSTTQTRPSMADDRTESSSTRIAPPSLASTNTTAFSNCYLYYRIYTEDSPVASAKPVYSNDSFLGRIQTTAVVPPQKVVNIKHCIFLVEGIITNTRADLFTAMSNESPTADDEHIEILDTNSPGSRPEEPMALIVKSSDIGAKSRLNLTTIKLRGLVKPSKPMKTRYLYYRIYTASKGEGREVSPKRSVRFNGSVLGGIDVDSIAPPHTVASLKRRIARTEGVDSSLQYDLFVFLGSQSPVADGPLSIMTDNCPGSTPNSPMALVCSSNEQPPALPDGLPPEFTEIIKGKHDCNDGHFDPKFINFRKGELLYTNGRLEDFISGPGGRGSGPKRKVYQAVNGNGKSGLVKKDDVLLLNRGLDLSWEIVD